MELEFEKRQINIDGKTVNNLDKFVLSITKILEKYTNYVIVSGYVAIFFGRTRATEDIDILVENKNISNFLEEMIKKGHWIINTTSTEDAVDMLNSGSPIRIAKNNNMNPNVEIKFPKMDLDRYALNNKIKVVFDHKHFFTSEIELQIVYKFLLGSPKDIEDALHIFNVFKDNINRNKIIKHSNTLDVKKTVRKYLGDKYV